MIKELLGEGLLSQVALASLLAQLTSAIVGTQKNSIYWIISGDRASAHPGRTGEGPVMEVNFLIILVRFFFLGER